MTITLPFRATVFLKSASNEAPVSLMERAFAREADAVTWCRVMTEAQPTATGVWFVATLQGGRTMTVMRDSGIDLAIAAIARESQPARPMPQPAELSSAEVARLSEMHDNDFRGNDVTDQEVRLLTQVADAVPHLPLVVHA